MTELEALQEARSLILNEHLPCVPHPGYMTASDDEGYTWQTNLSAYVAHPDLRNTSPIFCNHCHEPNWEDRGRTYYNGLGQVVHRTRHLTVTVTGAYPCEHADLLLSTYQTA